MSGRTTTIDALNTESNTGGEPPVTPSERCCDYMCKNPRWIWFSGWGCVIFGAIITIIYLLVPQQIKKDISGACLLIIPYELCYVINYLPFELRADEYELCFANYYDFINSGTPNFIHNEQIVQFVNMHMNKVNKFNPDMERLNICTMHYKLVCVVLNYQLVLIIRIVISIRWKMCKMNQ